MHIPDFAVNFVDLKRKPYDPFGIDAAELWNHMIFSQKQHQQADA